MYTQTSKYLVVNLIDKKKRHIDGFLPRDPPDRTSLSSLSMDGEGTLDRGLPGREHSEPASNESS